MDGGGEVISMAEFVYLVGAWYLAITVARLSFWIEDVIEGKR